MHGPSPADSPLSLPEWLLWCRSWKCACVIRHVCCFEDPAVGCPAARTNLKFEFHFCSSVNAHQHTRFSAGIEGRAAAVAGFRSMDVCSVIALLWMRVYAFVHARILLSSLRCPHARVCLHVCSSMGSTMTCTSHTATKSSPQWRSLSTHVRACLSYLRRIHSLHTLCHVVHVGLHSCSIVTQAILHKLSMLATLPWYVFMYV